MNLFYKLSFNKLGVFEQDDFGSVIFNVGTLLMRTQKYFAAGFIITVSCFNTKNKLKKVILK